MPRTHLSTLTVSIVALTLLGVGFLTPTPIQNHSSSEQLPSYTYIGADESLNNGLNLDTAGAASVHDSTQTTTEVEGRVMSHVGEKYGRLPLQF